MTLPVHEEFDSVVRSQRRKLVRVAARYCKSEEAAEDAVQEALLKAWAGLDRFRGEAKMLTWLTRIVVNEVLQALRRQHPERFVEITSENEDYLLIPPEKSEQPGSPECKLLLQELDAQLLHALKLLPRAFEDILTLYILGESSIEESARALKISTASAKSRIYRGRRELRRRWFDRRFAPQS